MTHSKFSPSRQNSICLDGPLAAQIFCSPNLFVVISAIHEHSVSRLGSA